MKVTHRSQKTREEAAPCRYRGQAIQADIVCTIDGRQTMCSSLSRVSQSEWRWRQEAEGDRAGRQECREEQLGAAARSSPRPAGVDAWAERGGQLLERRELLAVTGRSLSSRHQTDRQTDHAGGGQGPLLCAAQHAHSPYTVQRLSNWPYQSTGPSNLSTSAASLALTSLFPLTFSVFLRADVVSSAPLRLRATMLLNEAVARLHRSLHSSQPSSPPLQLSSAASIRLQQLCALEEWLLPPALPPELARSAAAVSAAFRAFVLRSLHSGGVVAALQVAECAEWRGSEDEATFAHYCRHNANTLTAAEGALQSTAAVLQSETAAWRARLWLG